MYEYNIYALQMIGKYTDMDILKDAERMATMPHPLKSLKKMILKAS